MKDVLLLAVLFYLLSRMLPESRLSLRLLDGPEWRSYSQSDRGFNEG
jgi:hypothetical protein